MRRVVWFFAYLFLSLGFSVGIAFATDQSSANFQNKDSTFAPATFSAASPNFRVSASLDPIVGGATNLNFTVFSGVPLNDPSAPVTPPPPPSGGGGGGGLSGGSGSGTGSLPPPTGVPAPTFMYRSPTFKSHQLISGTHYAATVVLVNGSENGVTYPDATHWQRDLPLFLGLNDISVQAKDASGTISQTIVGQIERMLIGDVNRDHHVNDFDLSLFTRAWSRYNFFADFNEDTHIDDIDLSLLVSHWGLSY